MMPSTFTTFDMIMTYSSSPSFSYMYGIMPTLMFLQTYWITPSTRNMFLTTTLNVTYNLIKSTNSYIIKGTIFIMTPTLISIITLNMWGAAPFTVTMTSHLMTTLSMGAPSWMSMIIISITLSWKSMSAHFLPENTPHFIASFLSLVETLSSYIRPITLSFRLSANISAGHVILSMMTSAGVFTMLSALMLMFLPILMSTSYSTFELAICLVQAFVFTLLASMYSNDYIIKKPYVTKPSL